jgi:riboflavin biosynthesis pyrimidine reductase
MSVLANLVLGSDGSTTLDGSSKSLSSAEDRRRFHELRAQASVILIGGNTARNEPYAQTPVPLVVITRSGEIPDSVRANPKTHIWDLDPISAVDKALKELGGTVLVEAGMSLIQGLLVANKIDELYLTLSKISGGENVYDLSALTREFTVESSEKIDGETFLKLSRN